MRRRSRRSAAELKKARAALTPKACSCGHTAVQARDYYGYPTLGGKWELCVDCYRELERERQRLYRGGEAATLKTAGHEYSAPSVPRDAEVEAALGVLRDARAQRQGKQGYVYLIIEDLPGGGIHYGKIGYSTNPAKRVAELQTGNPRPLRLLYAMPGTEDDERRLHAKYIKFNALQEWFVVTKELLLEFPAQKEAANK